MKVLEVARDEQVDLIVLAWSRDLSGGHAQVVLDSLTRATVPTLLVAVHAGTAPSRATGLAGPLGMRAAAAT